MSNTDFQKVADAIERSPQEIKDLMFSSDFMEKIGTLVEKNRLKEDEAYKLADEIGYVILDIKPRSSFFQSLTEAGLGKDVAMKIASGAQSNIFDELDKIKKGEAQQENKKNEVSEQDKKIQRGVGQSFEELILNQARAMQPARPAGEAARVNSQVPENLPTGGAEPKPIEKTEPRVQVPNYGSGNDPYREPLE